MQTDGTNIAGKVVVITGASSGLGDATARYLAERGATVVLAPTCEPGSTWVASNPASPISGEYPPPPGDISA